MSEGQSPEVPSEKYRRGGDEEAVSQEGQNRVEDAVEAEHMAHAMKPHVERAQAIDRLYHQNWQDDEGAREGTAPEDEASSHAVNRDLHVEAERSSLSDAEYEARRAADEAGQLTSERYQREHDSHDIN